MKKNVLKSVLFLMLVITSFKTIAQPLTANAGTDHAICAGAPDSLASFGSFGTPPYTYMWTSQVTTLADPTMQVIFPISPASTETFTVVVTDNASATASASVTITVNSNPTPAISPTGTILDCNNTSISLTANGGSSYSWNTGETTTTITITAPGTYTLIAGDTTGCTGQTSLIITQDITPPMAGFNVDLTSGCAPLIVNFSNTSVGSTYWSWLFGDGNSSNFSNPSNGYTTSGTYNATLVAYSNGGCADTISSTITVYPNPIAGFMPDVTSGCVPLTVNFTDMSSGASSYQWNFGDGNTSTLTNPSHIFSQGGVYPVGLTVTSVNGCVGTANSINIITSTTNIYGNASYSSGGVAYSKSVLYFLDPITSTFDTAQYVETDDMGNYTFTNVANGQYLIKVFPDTATYHTSIIPTYYGNKFQWDSAFVINHTCSKIDTANITMIEPIGTGTGPGRVWGFLREGPGFVRNIGDPIPDVDVKLGKNPGGIAASSTTNNLGNYTWKNLDFGSYTIYVDIPGLPLDSTYTFIVDGTNNQYAQLNFTVDSSGIYKDTFIVLSTKDIKNKVENDLKIFPNPSNGNVTIDYTTTNEGTTSLAIYNILGVKVADIVNANQSIGTHKYKINTKNYNLNTGVYFITLVTNSKTTIKRLVISE